jgi:hypothetical protein
MSLGAPAGYAAALSLYIVRYIPIRLKPRHSIPGLDSGVQGMGPKFKLDSYDLALVLALALFIVVAASLAFASPS